MKYTNVLITSSGHLLSESN